MALLVEKSLKWSAIGLVGLMVAGSLAGTVFVGVFGLLADPAVLALVVIGFVMFGLLLGVPALGLGIWLWRWWRLSTIEVKRAAQFVAPDEAGRLPVPASLLRQPEFAHRAMDNHAASYMSGISSFNYQPQQTLHGAAAETMTAAATIAPGTFWQLYQAGQLPSRGFLLGNSLDGDGEAITADWNELYSSLIGGKSGTGKSTLIRSLLAQSALQGGRFVVVDPHYASGDESLGASLAPLRNLMLCDVAADERQIVDALVYVGAIGQRRLKGQDKERWPLILIVDETTALFQRSNVASALTDVLGQISQETRKVGVYAMCIGQNFDGRIIDTTVRNSFVSQITMRARRDVARVQSGSTEFGRMAETLTIGQCVWMAPSGEMHRLAVPNCTAADLEMIAHSFERNGTCSSGAARIPEVALSSKQPSTVSSVEVQPIVWQVATEDTVEDIMEDTVEDTALNWNDPKVQNALNLMSMGHKQTDIIKEVWGIQAPSGRKYEEAARQLRRIVAELVKRSGRG